MNQNTLVRFLYEAIEHPLKRPVFLATFTEIPGAKAAAIKVEDRQLRWSSFRLTHGMDRAPVDSYVQYYVGLNPLALRGVSKPGEVRTSER